MYSKIDREHLCCEQHQLLVYIETVFVTQPGRGDTGHTDKP